MSELTKHLETNQMCLQLILRLLYRMLFTNEPTIDLREYDDESSAETASLSSLDDCKSEKKRKKLAKKEKEKEKAKID